MKVLVTAASKYGSTAGIAQAIGDVLITHRFDVAALPFDAVEAVDDYDAVALGSAVYAGHWLSPAKEFVEQCCSSSRDDSSTRSSTEGSTSHDHHAPVHHRHRGRTER